MKAGGGGGVVATIGPFILNLVSRWRWVINFMPWLLYTWWMSPNKNWIRVWVSHRTGLDIWEKRKFCSLCWKSYPGLSSPWPGYFINYAFPALKPQLHILVLRGIPLDTTFILYWMLAQLNKEGIVIVEDWVKTSVTVSGGQETRERGESYLMSLSVAKII